MAGSRDGSDAALAVHAGDVVQPKLAFPHFPPGLVVRRRLLELVEANQAYDATLRIAVVRNGGGMWEGPSNGRASDIIALTADLKNWGAGVKLSYVEQARHALAQPGVRGLHLISFRKDDAVGRLCERLGIPTTKERDASGHGSAVTV